MSQTSAEQDIDHHEKTSEIEMSPSAIQLDQNFQFFQNKQLALSAEEVSLRLPNLEKIFLSLNLGKVVGVEQITPQNANSYLVHLDNGKKVFLKDRNEQGAEPLKPLFDQIIALINDGGELLTLAKTFYNQDLDNSLSLPRHNYLIQEYVEGITLINKIFADFRAGEADLEEWKTICQQLGAWLAFNYIFGSYDGHGQNYLIDDEKRLYQLDFYERTEFKKPEHKLMPFFQFNRTILQLSFYRESSVLRAIAADGFNEALKNIKSKRNEINELLSSNPNQSFQSNIIARMDGQNDYESLQKLFISDFH